MTRDRRWVGYLLALALLALQIAWFWHATIEDAYISFRYARNWADHLGLVFNPGEWIEGYSNFSWTLLLGLAARAGSDLVVASKVLGLGATLALMALLVFGARRCAGEDAGLAGALIAGCSTPLAFWTVAGLETSLAALLTALALFLYPGLRWPGRASDAGHRRVTDCLYALPLAVATLTRPEALGLAVLLIGWDLYRRRGRATSWALLLYALCVIPYLIWRWSTYGGLTPNSLYAKAGIFESLRSAPMPFITASLAYLGNWMLKWGLIWWLPLAWAARQKAAFLPLAFTLGYTAVVVLTGGGDWMPLQRLWLPALAPWLWLAVLGWQSLQQQHRRLGSILISLLILAQLDLAALRDVPRDTRHLDHWWVETMATLYQLGQDTPLPVATTVLGRTGYYFSGRVLDAFGLADSYIAHHGDPVVRMGRLDWEYVLAQQPTFILVNDSQAGLRQRMAEQYMWLPLPAPPDFPVALFVRADRAGLAGQAFAVSPLAVNDPDVERLFTQRLQERQRAALAPLYENFCITSNLRCNTLWLLLKP